jgi:hypothetical protein
VHLFHQGHRLLAAHVKRCHGAGEQNGISNWEHRELVSETHLLFGRWRRGSWGHFLTAHINSWGGDTASKGRDSRNDEVSRGQGFKKLRGRLLGEIAPARISRAAEPSGNV